MNNKENIVLLGEERLTYFSWWRRIIWTTHLWFVGLSCLAAVMVPFGLAVLLYIDQQYRESLNVYLLIVSFIGLALQGLDNVWRLPDRASILKQSEAELSLALSSKRDEKISQDEFKEVLEKILTRHSNHDGQ